MKRKVYSPHLRFLLIKYKDGKVVVIHTMKPYNDINDFPKHDYEPMECKDISFIDFVYWNLRILLDKSRMRTVEKSKQ